MISQRPARVSSVCVGVAGTPKALLCQWTFLGGGALLYTGRRLRSSHAHFSTGSSLSLYPSLAAWGPALDSETRCPLVLGKTL